MLKGVLNECAVTVIGANDLQVDTGLIMCAGGVVVIETHEHLAPVSAGPGLTRKDSVICELDLDGSGSTEQYTVRVVLKQGTAGAYPAMTQSATLWQIELYRYIVDDAGAITGLTDVRQYLRVASEFDHGELLGLADDDHNQYYNAARHTTAVHDALGINAAYLEGHDAAYFTAGIAMGFSGATVLFGGALGGSDGHRPIDPITAAAHEDWHWANGELVAGVQTLDSRGKMVLGSDGAAGTYPVNSTGGAATVNLAHTHDVGTLAAANESAHTHAKGSFTTANSGKNHVHLVNMMTTDSGAHTHAATTAATGMVTMTQGAGLGAPATTHTHAVTVTPVADHAHSLASNSEIGDTDHTHNINGSSAAGSAHAHALSGSTLTNLSAAQSVMNPFRAWYLITFVG